MKCTFMWKCRECDNEKYGIKINYKRKVVEERPKITRNEAIVFFVINVVKNCDETLL